MSAVSDVIKDKDFVLKKVADELEGKHGIPLKRPRSDPLDVLISTILSQNTNGRNSSLAHAELKRRFPNWEALLRADQEEIAGAIKVGGLAQQKAGRIKEILLRVLERWGRLTLSPICAMRTEDAMEVLLGLRGVGLKTATCVLAFGCSREVFPVDTHILRITQRLGLIPAKTTAERAHGLLAPLVPVNKAISLHLNLIRYGRDICRARQPKCGLCLFPELCGFRREMKGERALVER